MDSEALNWVRAASTADLWPGAVIGVEIEGLPVAIYQVEDGGIFATVDVCTHAYALLSEGWLTGDVIECPLHGGCFNVRSGAGQGDPITEDLKTYPVRVVDDHIYVALS